jgi:hypothetical protein
MQWYFEIIPLIIGMLYRVFFYGIKTVIGVELGIRFLSTFLQIVAFHFGGLPADFALLFLGFCLRIAFYGPSFYLVEIVAFVASIVFRLVIYFSEAIIPKKEKEDKSRSLVLVSNGNPFSSYHPILTDILPVALTSF